MTTLEAPGRSLPAWGLVVMGYLGVFNLITGMWAIIAPEAWYRSFPGFGRGWVAASPPFNRHLVVDSGAGFLAVAVVLLIACIWRSDRVVQVALIGSLAHDVPHFVFHLLHPGDSLAAADKIISTGGLGFNCAIAVAVLLAVSRGSRTASE